jgi:hypothetical protein
METFDYTSVQFIERLRRLIRRLGECWDTDPRVAHIEMGLIGKWGEHHSPSPSEEVEQILGEEFRRAFKHKKVMVRHPWEFEEFEFGIYWDSWAHQDQVNTHGRGIADIGDRWKTEIIGGETAYNWGQSDVQPGEDPTDTMVDPVHRDFLIYTIRWLHCTQLRWVADYDQNNIEAREGAEAVQKTFGYRYVVDEMSYPTRIDRNQEFFVSFSVRNTGSAPFYYDWPVELSILDASGNIVWSADFFDADVRDWMPGDDWNREDSAYGKMAETYTVSGSFAADADIPAGIYRLALAVLDPAGRLPGLRFATKNYAKGGRHPIGYIGVGTDVEKPEIDPAAFDDPYADTSLRYIYDPALVGVSRRNNSPVTPRTVILRRNYPNPFNPSTCIGFSLPAREKVTLEVFDVLGKKVATLVDNRVKAPGEHIATFDGSELSSGLYFCRLRAGQHCEMNKMMLVK